MKNFWRITKTLSLDRFAGIVACVAAILLLFMAAGFNLLTVEITDTVSLIEATQSFGGIAGLWFTIFWTSKAERDRVGLVKSKLNGGRLIAAQINLTIGYIMSLKMALYIVIGCTAMTTGGVGYVTTQSLVIGLAIISNEALAVWMMAHITYLHDALIGYYDDLAERAAEASRLKAELDAAAGRTG